MGPKGHSCQIWCFCPPCHGNFTKPPACWIVRFKTHHNRGGSRNLIKRGPPPHHIPSFSSPPPPLNSTTSTTFKISPISYHTPSPPVPSTQHTKHSILTITYTCTHNRRSVDHKVLSCVRGYSFCIPRTCWMQPRSKVWRCMRLPTTRNYLHCVFWMLQHVFSVTRRSFIVDCPRLCMSTFIDTTFRSE